MDFCDNNTDEFIRLERYVPPWADYGKINAIKYAGETIYTKSDKEHFPCYTNAKTAMKIISAMMKNRFTQREIQVLKEIIKFFFPDENLDMIDDDWKSVADCLKQSIYQFYIEPHDGFVINAIKNH